MFIKFTNFIIKYFRIRVLVWFLITGFAFSFVPIVSLAKQPTATISRLSGTVLVNGKEQEKGTALKAGDIIETKAGESVALEFSDGSLLELVENTKIDLTELSKTATGARITRIRLWWGRIQVKLSSDHQQEGAIFDIETPNALVGVTFSQPDVEISYDLASQETVALSLTVALAVKNLVTDEEKIIPIGTTAIITAVGIKVIGGAAATGTIVTGTSTGTKIAIGAGVLAAAGGAAAVAPGGGGGEAEVIDVSGTWTLNLSLSGITGGPECFDPNCDPLQGCTGSYTFTVSQSGNVLSSSFYNFSDGTINGTLVTWSFILPPSEDLGCGDWNDFTGTVAGNIITGSYSGHDCVYNCQWGGSFNLNVK